MSLAARKENTSLEGFEHLWEATETPQSIDSISKQIHAILKVLVDERIALNQEHQLVTELKQNINSLETQIQKLNWQLGQREQELSSLYTEHHKLKVKLESTEKQSANYKELLQENKEIRAIAEQLSNQILQEKAKNEQLVELLKMLDKPEFAQIAKRLGI
jgi:septal ring factor EnvC (AmiA/AmiB activator)